MSHLHSFIYVYRFKSLQKCLSMFMFLKTLTTYRKKSLIFLHMSKKSSNFGRRLPL